MCIRDSLYDAKSLIQAEKIEDKIWKNWTKHPKSEYLTSKLENGTYSMYHKQYQMALKLFTDIIKEDPKWAEGWNKRATLLFIMGNYEKSLNDIEKVLGNDNASLFEILTCAFLKYAENYKDNINIIEAGLFFQFDSTNVFKHNLMTLIGVIHTDHLQWLKNKTIDGIIYEDVFKQKIKVRLGLEEKQSINKLKINEVNSSKSNYNYDVKDRIAILFAKGPILYGEGTESIIAQEVFVET